VLHLGQNVSNLDLALDALGTAREHSRQPHTMNFFFLANDTTSHNIRGAGRALTRPSRVSSTNSS